VLKNGVSALKWNATGTPAGGSPHVGLSCLWSTRFKTSANFRKKTESACVATELGEITDLPILRQN